MTSNGKSGKRYLPHAFTEQRIYMLMTVLKGVFAIKQSLAIIRLFKQMKNYLAYNVLVFQRLARIELKQIEADENFKQLEAPKQQKAVLFFKGQIYDAFNCIATLIGKAKKELIFIDGYVDTPTLDLLSKKNPGVNVTIITYQKTCKITNREIDAFSSQYGSLDLRFSDEFHDRFVLHPSSLAASSKGFEKGVATISSSR